MAHLPKGKAVLPLPPFRAWLASNIPQVYDNTMTYYEELCALIKYLQSVVLPALNENAAAVTVISNAVEKLQKYVDDYFKNLDVQEEINNKLDEMAEDGTLEEIIGSYLQLNAEWCFDTISEMQSATNLINGSYARTSGYYSVNDGGEALYYINDNESDISVNGHYAHLVYKTEMTLEAFGCKGDDTTDNTVALQKAIKASSDYGIKLIGKKGSSYKINGSTINLYSDVNIDLNGAIIHSNSLFFLSDPNSVGEAGYSGIKNVIFKNGTLKGHTEFVLYHALDITVDNIKFESCIYDESHIFDLGGCKGITIKNCEFYGNDQDSTTNYREAIQLDYATNGSQPYWQNNGIYAYYDGIPTIDVIIKNCTFKKKNDDLCYFNAIGAHSMPSEASIDNVTIENCTFDGWTRNAIRFIKVKNLNILNNTFIPENLIWSSVYSASAIDIEYGDDTDVTDENIRIENNKLISTDSDKDKLFIRILSNNLVKNVKISNNEYKGQYDFLTLKNIDNIIIKDNNVDKCASFVTKTPNSSINTIISEGNSIKEFDHLYHSSSSDSPSSTSFILNANNLLEQSSFLFNNSNCEAKITLSNDQSLTNPDSSKITFDTSSNILCNVINNELRPDRSIPKIKITGNITVKGSGASVDTLRVSIWDREKNENAGVYNLRYQGIPIDNWTSLQLPEVVVNNNILRNSTGDSRYSITVLVWGSGSLTVNKNYSEVNIEGI